MEARAFRIDDADPTIAKKFFEQLWGEGYPAKRSPRMGNMTKENGHSIVQYDVTGKSCTTHATNGIKIAGFTVFAGGYTTNSQMRIESVEDFSVPVSLQGHLINKNTDSISMQMVELTREFKKQHPNTNDLMPEKEGGFKIIFQRRLAEESSTLGKISTYSGGGHISEKESTLLSG